MATLAQGAFAAQGFGAAAFAGAGIGMAAIAPDAPPTGAEYPANQPVMGKVKVWRVDKGFGFLTAEHGGPDVFVHKNQLTDGQALETGACVIFQCRFNPSRGKYEATTCSGAIGGGASAAPDAAAAAGPANFGGTDNCFVAGMPMHFDEAQVREMFSHYGAVKQCKVLPDQPGKNDKAALVRFQDEAQAQWMVANLNGQVLTGMTTPITVRFAGDRGAGAAAPMGGGYGKMGGGPVMDNRFNPYGGGNAAQAALYGVAPPPAAAMQPMAAAAPQLDLAGALSQLLPALQQNPQLAQTLQGIQGLSGLTGLMGSAAPAAAAPAAAPVMQAMVGLTAPASGLDQQLLLQQQAPAADASGGTWLEAADPTTGQTYYYHSVTRETRWEKPN